MELDPAQSRVYQSIVGDIQAAAYVGNRARLDALERSLGESHNLDPGQVQQLRALIQIRRSTIDDRQARTTTALLKKLASPSRDFWRCTECGSSNGFPDAGDGQTIQSRDVVCPSCQNRLQAEQQQANERRQQREAARQERERQAEEQRQREEPSNSVGSVGNGSSGSNRPPGRPPSSSNSQADERRRAQLEKDRRRQQQELERRRQEQQRRENLKLAEDAFLNGGVPSLPGGSSGSPFDFRSHGASSSLPAPPPRSGPQFRPAIPNAPRIVASEIVPTPGGSGRRTRYTVQYSDGRQEYRYENNLAPNPIPGPASQATAPQPTGPRIVETDVIAGARYPRYTVEFPDGHREHRYMNDLPASLRDNPPLPKFPLGSIDYRGDGSGLNLRPPPPQGPQLRPGNPYAGRIVKSEVFQTPYALAGFHADVLRHYPKDGLLKRYTIEYPNGNQDHKFEYLGPAPDKLFDVVPPGARQ